jgi:predicted permease
VIPAKEELVADVRPLLTMLWAGVGFVLLIGCVNIANLMLARSQVRVSEVATRLALGAPRARVARQVLTEALVLSVVGGAIGIAAGLLGLRFVAGLGADQLPRGTEIGIDGPVLAFTAALAVAAALLFAAIPVLDVLRRDLSVVFRAHGRGGTASRGAVLLRNGMVTGQVGLAFVLLIGAGLMLVSFREALAVDPGFRSDGLHTTMTSLPAARYPTGASRLQFADEVVREIEALPSVEAVSVTTQIPFSGDNSNSVIFPEGYVPAPGESLLSPVQSWVGPGYFATLGIPVLEGREFEWADGPDGPNVLVIDRWLAKRYWPGESPLGRRMVFGGVPGADSVPEESLYTVVGVVETIKHGDLTAPAADHVGAYYISARYRAPGSFALVARARTGVTAASLTGPIRDVVTRLDPELAVFGVETMDDRIARSLVSRRTPMALLLVFAGVALFLAVIGIYGALAYAVTRRTREMGIRMAVGSDAGGIFGLILKHGLRVTAVGLVLGFVASLLLTGFVQSLLFGVQPLDWRVLAVVTAVLGGAALMACAVPAWRATRVDPMSALTTD